MSTLDDKLRLAEYAKDYYSRNKKRISEQRKVLYQKNKKIVNARHKAYREANREKYLAHEAEQRIKHKEYRNEYIKSYQKSGKGKEVSIKTTNKMRELYPERYKARYSLRNAVRLGKVEKTDCYCSSTKVEAHHHHGYDPAHWYDVQWLCRKHHREAHNVG